MWLHGKRDRRHDQDEKEDLMRRRSEENLSTLMSLSQTMHYQVERLEEVTDRLEGALNE